MHTRIGALDEQGASNFGFTLVETEIAGAPKTAGSKRLDPAYLITRDGFALLAMGFTGPEATTAPRRPATAHRHLGPIPRADRPAMPALASPRAIPAPTPWFPSNPTPRRAVETPPRPRR